MLLQSVKMQCSCQQLYYYGISIDFKQETIFIKIVILVQKESGVQNTIRQYEILQRHF